MSNFRPTPDVFYTPREPETEAEIKRNLEVQRALVRQTMAEIKLLQERVRRHKSRIREMEVKLRQVKKD